MQAQPGGGSVESAGNTAQGATANTSLTTAEAAANLVVSRSHVSMLCNSGEQGEVVMTEDGHRRVRAPAV